MKTVRIIAWWLLGFVGIIILVMAIFHTPDIPVAVLKHQYANADSRFIAIDGMQVHYRDVGPRSDRFPLVMLHGTASSLHTWDSIVKRLPDKRCISMDLPGFGLTGPHPQRRYDAASYISFLDHFLKTIEVDSPIVAGNSLGGFIAWNYAAGNPCVKALALLDPAGFPLSSKNSNLGFKIARIPVLNQLLKYITPKSLVRKSAEESYGNKSLVNDGLVDRYYTLMLRQGNRQALIDRLTNEANSDTSSLDRINIPTLIIWGELDQVVPFSHLANFKRHLPHATVATYKSVGHVPMEEAPDSVAASLRKWLPLVAGEE